MPNHISNKLTLVNRGWKKRDEIFDKIKNIVKSDKSDFDFNNLVPYPQKFVVMDEIAKKAKSDGIGWKDLPKDGFNSGGYEWCCDNWGTKWNAYDIYVGWGDITFHTAWSTPWQIWCKLSSLLPEAIIKVSYADEDIGSNCGILYLKKGKVYKEIDKRKNNTFARYINELVDANYYRDQYYKKENDQT